MRHRKSGRTLGRESAHRKAMFRNMVTSLMIHGRIRTTQAKAKELRRIAERIITLGKRIPPSALEGLEGDAFTKARAQRLHNIRRARRIVNDADALHKVFNEYAERFKERPGGYTRIFKIGYRPGDNAPMALIELIEELPGEGADDAVEASSDVVTDEDAAPAEEPAVADASGEE